MPKGSKFDAAAVTKANDAFCKLVYANFVMDVKPVPSALDPKSAKLEAMKDEMDESKIGQYTVNPELCGMSDKDFEALAKESSVKILDMKDMIGKPLYQVADAVIKTYSKEYYIPDFLFWRWSYYNDAKMPEAVKNGAAHYLFGTVMAANAGRWSFPAISTSHGEPDTRTTVWIGDEWRGDYRAIILKR